MGGVLVKNSVKVSVVSVCFNAEKLIEETILSVISQSCFKEQIEYVIIDGNSNDKTNAIIGAYKDLIDVYLSEPDLGIYDAMNKGVKYASGQFVLFLNAGDTFVDHKTIENLLPCLENVDVVYGNTLIIEGNRSHIRNAYAVDKDWKIIPYCHQSVLISREKLKQFPFSMDYKIAADFNQYHELKKSGATFKPTNLLISNYDNYGFSANNRKKLLVEYQKISLKYSTGLIAKLKIISYFCYKRIIS